LGHDFGHQEKSRPGIKLVPVLNQAVTPPAWPPVLFHNRDGVAVSRQAGGDGDAAYAGADY
jgi:hypothetical protein